MFLIERGGNRIINEYMLEGQVKDKTKTQLLNLLVDFIFEKFGLMPTREQKMMVSKAAVQLFPKLRTPNSKIDGIVSRNDLFLF